MSILIKSTKMPKSCYYCPLTNDGFYLCKANNQPLEDDCEERKPQWCPLIKIPSHGDLIERKVAYNSILDGMVMTGYQLRALNCISEFYVPTVIEGDEDE